MSRYLDLIYVGPEQALPILVALVLWIGLAGLGALFIGKDRLIEANVIFGWAIVSGLFTIVGVLMRAPFLYISILLALFSLIGIYRSFKYDQKIFIPGIWRVFILALPLLWIGGAMEPSQWDEFSHWLPASKYLLALNGFPNNELPYLGAFMFPAYPFGWPILTYLAGLVAGKFLDNVSSTINVLLLLSFSTFALRTALRVSGRVVQDEIRWVFAAFIVLFATLFNPTFIQKIVLTAYSDVSTSVVTGFSVLLGYYFLESLAGRVKISPLSIAAQFGLILSLLINVRQTNLVLFVIIVFAVLVLVLRDRDIRIGSFFKLVPIVVIPATIVYLAWRYHVTVSLGKISGAEARLLPFEAWNIKEIPAIIAQMGVVAFKKIGFFAPMLIACVFAVRGIFRFKTTFDRISVLVAILFLGYTSFLLLMYVGHFGRSSALSVISFWRYSTHNGMVAVAFISIGILYFAKTRLRKESINQWAKSLAIVSVLILPFGMAHKLRFDLEPPKPHFTRVAKEIAASVDRDTGVYIFDPLGTGESGLITRYHLARVNTQWLSAFHGNKITNTEKFFAKVGSKDLLLVHSTRSGVESLLGLDLNDDKSYLLRRKNAGWEISQEWEKPANHRN